MWSFHCSELCIDQPLIWNIFVLFVSYLWPQRAKDFIMLTTPTALYRSPCSLQPCPDRGVPYQTWMRLTWAWGGGLRRVHRETCLRGTPWVGRSSTSVGHCCCHCYSKSLCLDHCGQRERQVRATQLWTASAPTNHSQKPLLVLETMQGRFEEEGCS